jgi:hypothetical protein
MKTAADLAALTRQKTWDKDVVLWVGSEPALLHTLGQTSYVVLDLAVEASDDEKAGVSNFFRREHACTP